MAVAQQTASQARAQREDEKTHPIVMPPGGKHRPGHGKKKRRPEVDVERQ
jgi:hypothetical protein